MNKLLTTLLLLTIGQGIQAQRVCYSDGTITIEGDSILTNDQGRSDLSEGRERLGMGIALAAYALNENDSEEIRRSLERYAKFVRERLQYPDYRR